jgi:hypothetical protein
LIPNGRETLAFERKLIGAAPPGEKKADLARTGALGAADDQQAQRSTAM